MARTTIDPGSLRHRLSLEHLVETPDGCGGFASTWQLIGDVWAAMAPGSQTQLASTGNLNAQSTHQITIRWRSDCHPEMRFVKAGRIFTISTIVDPDETKRYLTCTCEETK